MSFTVLPAVDVAGGRAVRLVAGAGAIAVGAPLDVALAFRAAGAAWLHLVDVDAAFGRGANADVLAAVIDAVDLPVQLAGGISDDASLARALATGCARVVVGGAALADLGWCARIVDAHGDAVAFALDVRVATDPAGGVRHLLAPRGTTRVVGDLWTTLASLDRAGCARYVVTDVGRDGTLGGPNVELCRSVVAATPAAVLASGGVASIADLHSLATPGPAGERLEGAIVGGGLHAGRFTLAEALAATAR